MSSVKRDIEAGRTTVKSARIVNTVIVIVGVGGLLLGLAIAGWFF